MSLPLTPKIFLAGLILVFALFLLIFSFQPASAAGPITLDGNFFDWQGQTHITDPPGDANNDKTDIVQFAFATNPNDETAYFMAERLKGGSTEVIYYLYLDTDNDGIFSEANDRRIEIIYHPENNNSDVTVILYSGTGAELGVIASGANWGESREEGGEQVEWKVPFAALGIEPYQPIQMKLESRQGNHASDTTSVVQWSPADLLGVGLLAVILIGMSGWMAARRRQMA
ncbi:MAG: hypothetical protein HUU38_03085 [Anaerolineales bacterium]|nr:hypothetical protein [Anaerolineales bacterium]